MARTIAIVTAGGTGKRMKSSIYKQFIEIRGVPILALALLHFERSPLIDGIIITSPPNALIYTAEEIVDRFRFKKVLKIVEGGSERQFSVFHALQSVPADTELVLIHDGVRPFLTDEFLHTLIQEGFQNKAVVPVLKPYETIKRIEHDHIRETVNRNDYVLVQTPQVFDFHLIKQAFETVSLEENTFTDDAAILEKSGLAPIHIVKGLKCNIKITQPEDLALAEFYYDQLLKEKCDESWNRV